MADDPEVRSRFADNITQSHDVTLLLPATLPVATAGLPAQLVFVGRESELARLAGVLQPCSADSEQNSSLVSTVTGLAGIGKTALVVRAAHLAMDSGWFPGGANGGSSRL
jgi:hypothetical protein